MCGGLFGEQSFSILLEGGSRSRIVCVGVGVGGVGRGFHKDARRILVEQLFCVSFRYSAC